MFSPANSFGFMDGGIDRVYSEIFPGIQKTVQSKIKHFNLETSLGRFYLPIGSSIIVSTGNREPSRTRLLACVPTMFFPSNIQGTDNVYWATIGLLRMLQRMGLDVNLTVAIPCFGTGVGMMSPKDAASQVAKALNDFDKIAPGENIALQISKCVEHSFNETYSINFFF
jgi:O-acetyl-ADP-ribose deacetylase (regulator of RNase III)